MAVDLASVGALAGLAVAAFVAGAVNAVAGGGSLVTFPALLAAGVSSLGANATSTVALAPGSASSWAAYRKDDDDPAVGRALAVPSAVGGAVGTALALWAGDALFAALVPILVFGATALFAVAEPLGNWARRRAGASAPLSLRALAALQFPVAVYGGFFGAGIGILMLAAFSFAGMRDVHRMNGYKSQAALWINGVAAVGFALSGHVRWPAAACMAVGAILGGRYGARGALWLGQQNVRRLVIAIGVTNAVVLAWRQLRG